ncbi:methylenetetrahydrofolate reductase [Melitaea cinxia]|uniref:methylenetetrahydrofolate reductase n=1 Tax=Melitaea cinxia TaxID=113334 RepID=UPI001E27257E|nr:methylenetetrahydrofolate reductase [Melitaea cinxia]
MVFFVSAVITKMTRKIVEIIQDMGNISFSFEVTPDIREEELDYLKIEPLFFSITWHAQTHKCSNLEIAPLKLANSLINKGKNVLLHISCTNLRRDYVNMLLTALQDKGICNLFIILGENFDPSNTDFKSSQELIKYVRQLTGSYFCIGVAGFPNRDDKLLHLKEKIDSGADFILTQAFFDHSILNNFIKKSKELNIHVPVIPGIFPFETKEELEGFVKLCKVHVTNDFMEILNMKSGIEVMTKFVDDMSKQLQIKHFHLFTLNKIQRIVNFIDKINSLID